MPELTVIRFWNRNVAGSQKCWVCPTSDTEQHVNQLKVDPNISYQIINNATMMEPMDDNIKQLYELAVEISTPSLAALLDIPYDRLNNGGNQEVIILALKEDDFEWIKERIVNDVLAKFVMAGFYKPSDQR